MSYKLRRINPYWHSHPMIPTVVAMGAVLGLVGYQNQKFPLAFLGLGVAGLAILFAARPVVSAVLGTLGLFGGLVTFVFVPNLQSSGMTIGMKLLSTVLFALFYMILMDALVLVIAVLYNLFGTIGMGGIQLELEGDEESAGPQ